MTDQKKLEAVADAARRVRRVADDGPGCNEALSLALVAMDKTLDALDSPLPSDEELRAMFDPDCGDAVGMRVIYAQACRNCADETEAILRTGRRMEVAVKTMRERVAVKTMRERAAEMETRS